MAQDLDMNRLREDAARRAREMQARAHIPPPRSSKPTSPPPEEPRREPSPTVPARREPEPQEKTGSLLDAFFQDKERTIILALLLLLSGEGENHELLFALLFLLL
ncbi:MAG: hypothetical protein ACOYJZ_05665 [Acutalibacter sp.]|jgi:hypothetical protein